MFKRLLSFSVAVIIGVTFTLNQNVPVLASGELPAKNSAARHSVCTALSLSALQFYSGEYSYENLCSLSGSRNNESSFTAMQNNELYSALSTLMSETHTYYTKYSGYNKGALAYFWQSTDAVLGSSAYTMFYSDVFADSPGATLNREHIWPKSRASFAEKNGGADLHHLRPSLETVNKAKSNHAFGYVNGTYGGGYTVGRVDGEV